MRVPFSNAATKSGDSSPRPVIGIYSYAKGDQTSGQFEFDVSSFRDPAGQKQFKGGNGVHVDVRDWVGQDRRVPIIIKDCLLIAEDLVRPKADGKTVSAWVSFSFHDQHGKWIAPAVAELVANALSGAGFVVSVYHSAIKPEAK